MSFPANARLASQAIIEKALGYFGQENMLALFEYIKKMGIERYEVLDEPEKFAEALEKLFGKGAKILEKQIIMEICLLSGNVQFNSNMTLAEAIHKLKA
jgi:hypothetical protein